MPGLIVFLAVLVAMAFIVWLAVRDTKKARGDIGLKRSDEPDEEQGSGGQQMAQGASNEPDAPDYVELATFSRPWEAWLVRDALVERGIRAWVEDAGMDNPYRTATGVERVYVSVVDLPRARNVLAEAERESAGGSPGAELVVLSWRLIATGGLIGVVLVAFLPHGVRLLAFMVLITAALPWVLLKRLRGPPPPYDHDDRDDRNDRPS